MHENRRFLRALLSALIAERTDTEGLYIPRGEEGQRRMIRALLEGLCARWACENITKEQIEAMEENVYLAEFHAGKGHMEQMAELDNQFHHILYDACNSKILEHSLIDYHDYVLRIRRKTLSTIERSTQSNKEHRGIMEAIKAGNADLAERLADEHMKSAYDNMVRNGLYDIYKEQ